jgi:hypothetical protein
MSNWSTASSPASCVFTGRLRTVKFWAGHPAEQLLRHYEGHERFCATHGLPPPSAATRAPMLREINEFHGNDFSGVELVSVEFRRGVDLTRQVLPTAEGYLYLPDAGAAIDGALALLHQREQDDNARRAQ